jgi:hypothetical protein
LLLDIWVSDISNDSLNRAERRWQEVNGYKTEHSVHFSSALTELPDVLDVVIVSTSADVRANIVSSIAQACKVRYWLLEKVLAQNYSEILGMIFSTASSNGAWVNTPMHMWSLYSNIRKQYNESRLIHASFEEFRGLACSSIHYIDLVSRWNNSTPVSIDTSYLDDKWHPAERKNFWEIYGTLLIDFSDGLKLKLSSKEKDRNYKVKLNIQKDELNVFEKDGFAQSRDGKVIHGECELQSQLTAPLLESILTKGSCNLPTLKESAEQHRLYLNSLIDHWNNHMTDHCSRIPIT